MDFVILYIISVYPERRFIHSEILIHLHEFGSSISGFITRSQTNIILKYPFLFGKYIGSLYEKVPADFVLR